MSHPLNPHRYSINIKDSFDNFKEHSTENDIAASILTLCDVLQHFTVEYGDNVGHEICMGIRGALFGNMSSSHTLNSEIGSLREISESIDGMQK